MISIQYLRALAALLVVASHILQKLSQCGYTGFQQFSFNGAIGVDIFFIISGYVMCLTTKRVERGSLPSTVSFLKRRFLRIFPMYWALTLIALVIFLLAPSQVNMAGGETRIFESFLLLPTEGKYLVKNAWTLTYELYFYLLFGICLLFRRQTGMMVLIGLIAIPVIFSALIPSSGAAVSLVTHSLTLEFLFGIALFYLVEKLRSRSRPISPWVGLLLICAATIYLISSQFAFTQSDRFLSLGIPSFFVCLGFLLLEPLFAVHKSRLFEAIGNSSYSLYLIHPFVLAGVRYAVLKLGEPTAWTAPLVIAVMLAASIIAGYVSYVVFEDSADKFFKRRPRQEYLSWSFVQVARRAFKLFSGRTRAVSSG